jgi:hypothetical protein
VQLDQAHIAIHERSFGDNLDLALHVLRRHGGPLAMCAIVLIAPLAVANHLLLELARPDSFTDTLTGDVYYWLVVLVLIEAPVATALVTLYLGQALFVERPTPKPLASAFVSCLPQLLLLQVFMRLILIPPLITWIVPFGMWPYLNEVILLERNPLSGSGGRLSTMKRNAQLHRGASSEFMARALLAFCAASLLVTAVVLSENFLLENLFGLEADWTLSVIELQAGLWLVVVYFTVARYLSYLDQRIRYEGWEVELFLRAERERLTRNRA